MVRALHTQDIDVLVVSNGATGLTMALALASQGLRVHIVSRSRWLDPAADAQLIDRHAMAIFRELGVADDLAKAATPWPRIAGSVHASALGSDEIGRVGAGSTEPDGVIDIAQSTLVNILLRHATARGATIAFNGEYLGQQQDEHGVTVTLHDAVLDRIYTLRAGYLFGADGYALRGVEEQCVLVAGAAPTTGTIEARFIADLGPRLGSRPDVFNWIAAPDAAAGRHGAGLLRATSPWNEWVARWDVDMTGGCGEPIDIAQVRRCIQGMIGDDDIPLVVGETSLRPVAHQHAQARGKRRVFCGGNVIRYRTQPGGPGTNAGVRDAHELAWKLAMVVHGEAGAALLDSYCVDRAPVEHPRLTVITGGKDAGGAGLAMPLHDFVTGPSGSRDLAAALRAGPFDVPKLDQRRRVAATTPRPDREPLSPFAVPPLARSRGPVAAPRAGARQHAGH